ncbi:MAG: tryptophan halogenase family protein [Sphingorhabdus sp.]
MTHCLQQIVVLGGGTAGWLAASTLAAKRPDLDIVLIESPDVPTIGVGEGTWPTMRATLAAIGISETEFLVRCDASFKQGSRFDGWLTGGEGDSYYHPFTPPPSDDMAALLKAWQQGDKNISFAEAMTAQAKACDANLAPRVKAMPDYAGALNYGYHLDAGKFATLLMEHATQRLGVRHIGAHVDQVITDEEGFIETLELRGGGRIAGDLFIDCSGQSARLIGDACGVAWIDRDDVSFNDSALALQVPVEPGSPIASVTIGTAHDAGWFWDIALPSRRGIGCVYASRFLSDEEAEMRLRAYVAKAVPSAEIAQLAPRKLGFKTGHRTRFWHKNCIAIGLSAGFIEPLEASAIVLIELSLQALTQNFPISTASMTIHAERFNDLFRYRWDRIVEFLKLHYVLSKRTEPYWLAQRDPATIPPRLAQQLSLWTDQPPSTWDFPQIDEIFGPPSQQYVLYGMAFALPPQVGKAVDVSRAAQTIAETDRRGRALRSTLPNNRSYLDSLQREANIVRPAQYKEIA